MKLTCGVDWAEAHHDIALVDDNGVLVAGARIDTDATGFSAMLALIAEHGGSVEDTPIAIETDKNLLVVAAAEAGFTVYPINPRAAQPGRTEIRLRRRCGARAHFAYGPAHAPPAAGAERACASDQGARPSASGSNLGASSDHQPPAVGAVGVLSASAAGFSDSQAQVCAYRFGGSAVP